MTTSHILVLPGGGYSTHAQHETEPVVQWLSTLGYSASVCYYPLNVRHPHPLNYVQRRIAELRLSGIERVGVVGFSAGGHLAGLAAVDGSADVRPDFAVLAYPITSMELSTYRDTQDILLGPNPGRAAQWAVSVDRLVTATTPPMFIWHTAEDNYVHPEHSYRLAAALSAAGRPHALHVFEHGPHSLGLAPAPSGLAVSRWTELAADWIAELL